MSINKTAEKCFIFWLFAVFYFCRVPQHTIAGKTVLLLSLNFKIVLENVFNVVITSCVRILDTYQFQMMGVAYFLLLLISAFDNLVVVMFLSV